MRQPKPFKKPIYITRPRLPERAKLYEKIDQIWDKQWLTNSGPQHRAFEKSLKAYLKVPHLSLFCNGTLALQLACQALRLSGEVITSPFTFPATPHVLYWNNIKPVFCDIEDETLNIDPDRIESMITPNTTAIMPVHAFGYPCNIEKIDDLANKYGLKVIYDAAHCFGVKIRNTPIGRFGDVSMFSFHATKIFHTIEGGAISCQDPSVKDRLELSKNFGFAGQEAVIVPGINAKMNEIQAAVGLLMLDIINDEIKKRKKLTLHYRKRLKDIPGITFSSDLPGVKHNYYKLVVRVKESNFGMTRDTLHDHLKKYNVFTRKYFYPLCSQFQCYKNLPSSSSENLPAAERATKEVLSLPLYGSLEKEDVDHICDIISFIRASSKKD